MADELLAKLIELLLHSWVVLSQLLDADILGLVVGDAEVAIGAEEGFLDLFEV